MLLAVDVGNTQTHLGAFRDDRLAYLGARARWSSEYYQTEAFVETAGDRSLAYESNA
mgnify:CR=1 FL=1